MLHPNTYRGSIVAIVTPMNADESIDYETIEKLIDFHIDNGTSAIVSVGTTGESATLDHQEHIDVIKFMLQKANDRIPIIAGTGSNSTKEAIDLTLGAKNSGAAASLIVTPYYNRTSQRGLFEHFKAIANEVAIDIILYNVPSRTNCDLLPETIIKLAKLKNIIGVKEATGDLSRVEKIKTNVKSDFVMLSGDDATATSFIRLGGQGNISVCANIAPKQMAKLYSLALSGEYEKLSELETPFHNLYAQLGSEPNPIPVKWAMHKLGLIPCSKLRLPLVELDSKYYEQVSQALTEAGLL